MDESLLSIDLHRLQPRRRISLSPPSPHISPLPSVNPHGRPLRIRTRPRHFDSSPDIDLPQRCDKTVHVPLKMIRDFIDPQGRRHPICNECRRNNQRRPVSPIFPPSSEEDHLENRTHQSTLSSQPSQGIPARQPLQDVTAHHVNSRCTFYFPSCAKC